MKIPNNYYASVVLSEEDKNRVRELYEKYSKRGEELNFCFVDLLQDMILKEEYFVGRERRLLLREAFSNENSANLRNVFLCMVKGVYFCTEEELKIAHITM